MTVQDLYLTHDGLEKLQVELADLKKQRIEITQKIREAREFGDLSENAEYQEAKTKQSFMEGRIEEIEATLKLATIVDHGDSHGEVSIGSQVTVSANGVEKVYEITGSNEASPDEGKISNESPLGKALLGKHVKEKFNLPTPDGDREYTVIKIV